MSIFNQAQTQRRKTNSDDNLIPLINIVFLLLIFFMIAGKIEQIQDAGLTLPENSQTKPAVAQPITLQLSKDNEIHLNNEVVNFEELPDALTQLLQEHPANIAVRADKQVTYQDLDKVLDTLRTTGFSTINLFTLTTEAS